MSSSRRASGGFVSVSSEGTDAVDSQPGEDLPGSGDGALGDRPGRPRRDVRPAGTQRSGQDDTHADPGRLARADLGHRDAGWGLDAGPPRADLGTAGVPAAGLRVLPAPDRRADAPLPAAA